MALPPAVTQFTPDPFSDGREVSASSLHPAGRQAAWAEVGEALRAFEDGQTGFVGPSELLVAVGTR